MKLGKFARAVRWGVGLLAFAGLGWFLGPIHWNVLNIGNVSGIAVCAAVLLCVLLFGRIRRACAKSRAFRRIALAVLILFCAGLAWSAFLTGLMISGATAAPPESATVVVLGSKVSGSVPSADLRVRIEAAAAYLKERPQAVCIACGGQGPGENRTEAEVIRDGLAERGVDPARVLLEDKSTSTEENIGNALSIIGRNGLNGELAIVTDEYHEFRACSIARKRGVSAWAVPAGTPWYIFSACWARELLALTRYLLLP